MIGRRRFQQSGPGFVAHAGRRLRRHGIVDLIAGQGTFGANPIRCDLRLRPNLLRDLVDVILGQNFPWVFARLDLRVIERLEARHEFAVEGLHAFLIAQRRNAGDEAFLIERQERLGVIEQRCLGLVDRRLVGVLPRRHEYLAEFADAARRQAVILARNAELQDVVHVIDAVWIVGRQEDALIGIRIGFAVLRGRFQAEILRRDALQILLGFPGQVRIVGDVGQHLRRCAGLHHGRDIAIGRGVVGVFLRLHIGFGGDLRVLETAL